MLTYIYIKTKKPHQVKTLGEDLYTRSVMRHILQKLFLSVGTENPPLLMFHSITFPFFSLFQTNSLTFGKYVRFYLCISVKLIFSDRTVNTSYVCSVISLA